MNDSAAVWAMRRRSLVWLGAFAAGAARAQPAQAARVAWVSMDRPNPDTLFLRVFRDALRGLGWVEGRTVEVATWWADGSSERLKSMVTQIVASRPDVIVTTSGPAIRPFVETQVGPPIVFAFSADPVLSKVVQSWARPGVNRTGVSYFALDIVPKRMEMLRELLPRMKRLAIVGWPPHGGELLELAAARSVAERFGLEVRYWGAHTGPDVDAAQQEIERWRADAVMVFGGVVAARYADRLAGFSARSRIPAVSAWADFAEAGNVMTFGPVISEAQARLASFVDRILKGAKAADLPVELPTRFELVLNLKAARAIGLEVPRTLLLRADRVIE